jgi:hypothetical protein
MYTGFIYCFWDISSKKELSVLGFWHIVLKKMLYLFEIIQWDCIQYNWHLSNAVWPSASPSNKPVIVVVWSVQLTLRLEYFFWYGASEGSLV